jgi:hypothetical protein
MKISRSKRRRNRYRGAGMELAGALSIASQMALLCPPGFDEWVRQELVGDGRSGGANGRRGAGAESLRP